MVYFDPSKITSEKRGTSVDVNTLTSIQEWYFQDKDYFYKIIQGESLIDTLSLIWWKDSSFKILSTDTYAYKNNVYFYTEKLPADLNSFQILEKPTNNSTLNNGFTNIILFAKDKKNLYFTESDYTSRLTVLPWDYDTFTVINEYYDTNNNSISSSKEPVIATDKNHLYYTSQAQGLKEYTYSFDRSTFQIIWNPVLEDLNAKITFYFRDKNGNYTIQGDKIIKK
jgi:hypothetical protein